MDPGTAYSRFLKARRRDRGRQSKTREGSGSKIKAIHSNAT
jgi:hypothetical protein